MLAAGAFAEAGEPECDEEGCCIDSRFSRSKPMPCHFQNVRIGLQWRASPLALAQDEPSIDDDSKLSAWVIVRLRRSHP
jgi:hypothetical protein